jgi:ketosteroid isomerase-like protein
MRKLALRLALMAAAVTAALPLNRAALAHPPAIVSEAARKVISEEVAAFRRDVAAAIKAKNAKRLARMYSPHFVHTHATGKLDGKEERIAAVLKGEPTIETAPVTELVIRIPNDWVGVATGLSNIKSSSDGKTYAYRWTSVYVREGQSWQIAASHATQLHEIKP